MEEYFHYYCRFLKENGYDIVPFECCVGGILPGGGALGKSRIAPAIKTMEDFRNYPWEELPDRIPQYKPSIDLVHSYDKPFLLHSCGCIFSIMDDLIAAGIDAKHSNEDQIALFPEWVERYGNRIGNFGGFDVDAVCQLDKKALREYAVDILQKVEGHGGIAMGTGNLIPSYVPLENYLNMIEIVREYKGDFKE